MKQDFTQEWQDYQSGIDYNNKLDYYSKTDLNWRFYNGNQWQGITSNGLPTPVFNIARASINYFIASIMSQKIKLAYSAENIPDEPEEGTQEEQVKQFVELMSDVADLKWEKDKMDTLLREGLLDGANSGDIAAHVYWKRDIETGQDEKGDFCTELVDGVMFGNPTCRIVEKQPYILLYGRETVKSLKEEAKANGISGDLIEHIVPDNETTYQIGERGKIELDTKGDNGLCQYIIKYWKDDKGEAFWNKSTRYCPIVKNRKAGKEKGEFTEETKITKYPIAFTNWEKVKNSYHGMPVMSGIIPNQIIINQLFAMVAYWMRFQAFGKVVYNKQLITSWSNQIGTAIGVESLGPDANMSNLVYQLQAGDFNQGILEVINLAIKYTKDFIGASDAALGQVKPDNTSAIIAVQKAASIPLENVQSNIYQFVEDLGLIWGEFMLKKYGNRKVSYRKNGKVMIADFSTEQAKDILLSCKVDVGPSSYWSEILSMQTLDNLLNSEKLTLVQYLQRIPNGIIPQKEELIEELKALEEQAMIQEQQQGQWEQMAQFLESQPPEIQQQIMSLPPGQKEQAIQQLMATQQTPRQGVI